MTTPRDTGETPGSLKARIEPLRLKYPAPWFQRVFDEIEAALADSPIGPADALCPDCHERAVCGCGKLRAKGPAEGAEHYGQGRDTVRGLEQEHTNPRLGPASLRPPTSAEEAGLRAKLEQAVWHLNNTVRRHPEDYDAISAKTLIRQHLDAHADTPTQGCQCICHSYPKHAKLQDALEALRWHQDKLAKADTPTRQEKKL